jgi:hypothetical protein
MPKDDRQISGLYSCYIGHIDLVRIFSINQFIQQEEKRCTLYRILKLYDDGLPSLRPSSWGWEAKIFTKKSNDRLEKVIDHMDGVLQPD